MSKLLIKNIGRLQTPVGSYPHAGKAQGDDCTQLVIRYRGSQA